MRAETHIGINAHLLSSQAGYRSAGIHGYIYNTLAYLPHAAPHKWRFTAMVGKNNPVQIDGITAHRAVFDTESPSRRVVWEQLIQPFQLGAYDLYHAMAFVAPRLPIKQPFIVTVYDLSFVHYPQVLSTARRMYLRGFTKNTVQRATRVIAISHSTARDVVDVFGVDADKVDVAPPGTDFDRFKTLPPDEIAAFRQRVRLPQDYWLFLGTLEPRKNLVTLLKAYAQLPKDSRPALVLAGGKGWDYEDIFNTIDVYGLSQEVLTPGFIPMADLPLWYNGASLFVYPSLYEGFGIPPLEAMACGVPVIVADSSSLTEVVGESSALRVPPHNINAWHAALTTALDDSHWRKQTIETGQQAAKRYTWHNTANQTVMSYRHALGGADH